MRYCKKSKRPLPKNKPAKNAYEGNGDRVRFLLIFEGFSLVYLKMQSSKE